MYAVARVLGLCALVGQGIGLIIGKAGSWNWLSEKAVPILTVSRGHLENRDPAAVHRFLGFPRRPGTAMHHFLNGMPRLTQSHFRRACFCVNHKTSGSRPSRSEASHLDFPLEIASEAFNPANFFAARPSSGTISYPETGKCHAPWPMRTLLER